MRYGFRWNDYADQPHNIAPKQERFKHHLRYAPSYLKLMGSNMRRAFPVMSLYRTYRRDMYKRPVRFRDPFGISVSPVEGKEEEMLEELKELGIRNTLFRIPSWERDKLDLYERLLKQLYSQGFGVVAALLQQRRDVKNPTKWSEFLEEVFSRFQKMCSLFEVGHAWNRTKWGVWDHQEYLELVSSAASLAKKHGIKLLGPAVIDFEFHLYPPVIEKIPFEKITSLLYVDRMGAPENTQWGWDTSRKVALLRAVIDGCLKEEKDLWITEMNWPLSGTGRYSPAVGRANVSEQEQADYLVRYFLLCLATGFIQRIYWWQLAAPGYGLIDTRGRKWRRRPSFLALANMVKHTEGSFFSGRIPHPKANIFMFQKNNRRLAVCWAPHVPVDYTFSRPIFKVFGRSGENLPLKSGKMRIGPSPKYVYFRV